MTSRQPRNMAASVRQRLMNLSRERTEEFQLVLTRYGLERLLYRVAQSPHAEQFVLKGAALFQLWSGQPHRSTRDLDLLGQGEPSTGCLRQLFQDVCSLTVDDDGLTFLTDAIQAEQIKEDDEYQGIRLRIEARLGNARIPLHIDIGFGDAITPGPQAVTYPALLDFPAPQLNAYPRETVVAEKFQAMVQLGMANSRMKDCYDAWTLARQFEFDGTALCGAIRATFQRRQTALPATTPLALDDGQKWPAKNWPGWTELASRLRPDQPGLRERQVIIKLLSNDPLGLRAENSRVALLDFTSNTATPANPRDRSNPGNWTGNILSLAFSPNGDDLAAVNPQGVVEILTRPSGPGAAGSAPWTLWKTININRVVGVAYSPIADTL